MPNKGLRVAVKGAHFEGLTARAELALTSNPQNWPTSTKTGGFRPGQSEIRSHVRVHENANASIPMLIFHKRKRRQNGLYSSVLDLGCRASPPYFVSIFVPGNLRWLPEA